MAVPAQWRKPGRHRSGATFAVALTIAAMGLWACPAHAQGKSAVLVLDANTGRVLHESSPDEPRHPASLAKMMTIYLAFELIEQGRLTSQTRIKLSANAVAAAPSKLDLEEGEEIALVDAIKVLITKSANDIAVAVAEHIAGSEEKFARLMTQKARQLGMSATTFRNASGLPDDQQLTTARDMMILALRLQDDFPTQYALFGTRTFTYKDETFRNHNTLLFHYPGTDGLKTGYTRASGFNLVASVKRGSKHVVGVVFGGASAASRNAAMRTYLNMGLVKASSERTRRPSAPLIARATPRPDRTIAAVPTPQRVDRPAVQRTTGPSGASPQRPTSTPPAIEIARVRPVLVAPRGPATHPADTAADQPITIEALLDQRHADHATGGDRAPSPVPPWASASMDPMPTRLSAPAPADRPAFLANGGFARGTAPSTFEQQAANLARGEAAVGSPPAISSSPMPMPGARQAVAAASSTGGFHIQVGAYQSEVEAHRQLGLVRERLPALLGDRVPLALQVRQGDKVIYRARYAGFAAQAAAAGACSELKRLKLDCIVLKGD